MPAPTKASKRVFAPVIMALVLVSIAWGAAFVAWQAADQYLPQLNIAHPYIATQPPILNSPPSRQTRRVILVILDGLRLRDSFGRPTLESMRRLGVDAIASSHYPTISRPNHTTLVTGVPPLVSGVRNNTFRTPVAIDSLMDRLQAQGMRASYVADDSPSLGYLFSEDFASIYYGAWPGAFVKSAKLSMANPNNQLLVWIPGSIDLAGHKYGGDSPQYREAVDRVDAQLAEALTTFDPKQDTLILTADHGHTDRGGHGGTEPVVVQVPLIFVGAGINANALLGSPQLIDIAPTIASLLGLSAPGHALGRTLVEVLQRNAQEKRLLEEADHKRITQNTSRYEHRLKERRKERTQQEKNRFVLFIAALLFFIIAFALARKSGALHMDWRVLLLALPAFPLCYYGLLHALGANLSFSALQDQGSEMSKLMRFGMVATLVQVLAGWIVLQGRIVLRDRLAAANALVAAGLLVAWIPAALLWLSHGSAPHIELPSSRIALLIPANYIAVATYAFGAALLLGLEIVVFFARALDPRIRLRRLQGATRKRQKQAQ